MLSSKQKERAIELAIEGRTLKNIREELKCTNGQLHGATEIDPEFAKAFSRARSMGYDELAEELLRIPEEVADVQRARLKSDNIKWVLSKRKAETYGDRIDINLNQTIDISGALAEARARSLPPSYPRDVTQSQPIDMIDISTASTTDTVSVAEIRDAQKITSDDIFD